MWLRALLPFVLLLGVPPAGGGDPRDLPPAMTGSDLRVERFVVYTQRTEAGRAPTLDVAGFVEWRRRDLPEGQKLECDARFLVGAPNEEHRRAVQRVVHVECAGDGGPRCLWREIGPGAGRSVQAEWSADGRALDVTEWSPAAKRRGTLVVSGGATMPLYLAELLRLGRLTAGRVVVFDPLALSLEPLDVRTVWLDGSPGLSGSAPEEADGGEATSSDAVRTSELRRADGSLAARYRFRGRELVAFQWQDGGTFARAVDEDEYERLSNANVDPGTSARKGR